MEITPSLADVVPAAPLQESLVKFTSQGPARPRPVPCATSSKRGVTCPVIPVCLSRRTASRSIRLLSRPTLPDHDPLPGPTQITSSALRRPAPTAAASRAERRFLSDIYDRASASSCTERWPAERTLVAAIRAGGRHASFRRLSPAWGRHHSAHCDGAIAGDTSGPCQPSRRAIARARNQEWTSDSEADLSAKRGAQPRAAIVQRVPSVSSTGCRHSVSRTL
jgi:hypothetical protein